MALDLFLEIIWLVYHAIFLGKHVEDVSVAWEYVLLSRYVVRDADLLTSLVLDAVDWLFIEVHVLTHFILVAAGE